MTIRNILLTFTLFFAVGSSFAADQPETTPAPTTSADQETTEINETHEIAAEIANLKENDAYIKKYLAIKDQGIRYFLTAAQKAKLVAPLNDYEKIKTQFIFDGYFLYNLRKCAVQINQEQAPKLYGMIKEFADKQKMQMPFIFVSFDKKLYNAFAQTFSKTLTAITIGEQMINDMSDNQLRSILAHEFGHLVNDTQKCVSVFDRFLHPEAFGICLCISLCMLWVLATELLNKIEANGLRKLIPTLAKEVNSNKLQTLAIALLAACPILYTIMGFYLIQIGKHNQGHEVDADKFSVDITNDPESFTQAMEKLKNYYLKHYATADTNLQIFEESVNELKTISEKRFNELNTSLTSLKNSTSKEKNEILVTGSSHPAMDKRIEFGKQEAEKRKKQRGEAEPQIQAQEA